MAQRMLAMVPDDLHELVLEPNGAAAVGLALLLAPGEQLRDAQLALLEARLGAHTSDRIARAAGHLAQLSPTLQLAILDLASPALRHLPEARQEDLLHLVQRLAELDGVVSPREAALAAAIRSRLRPEENGQPDATGALALMALLAHTGHDDAESSRTAWASGVEHLRAAGFPLPEPLPDFPRVNETAGAQAAERAARLAAMDEPYRKALVEALAVVASQDGELRSAELQMLRTASTALGVPMPPPPA
jgi:uncharacterized tellurite resistance protein B-like protein